MSSRAHAGSFSVQDDTGKQEMIINDQPVIGK
jgi:hypothetical protein